MWRVAIRVGIALFDARPAPHAFVVEYLNDDQVWVAAGGSRVLMVVHAPLEGPIIKKKFLLSF